MHIKKYGYCNVRTIWVSDWYYDSSIIEDALNFSQYHQIVTSTMWANLIEENGINGGGNCSQMHTQEIREKALLTRNNKTNYEIQLIYNKRQNTIKEKYNCECFYINKEQTIEKRNNTNLERYGSKCAANKSPEISKQVQQERLNRPIIKQIKCISPFTNESLKAGWYYLPNILLQHIYKKCCNNLKQYNNFSKNNIIQKYILILMMVNKLKPLKLKQNWFRKSDIDIEKLYYEIFKTHQEFFDIPLQTYHQFFEEC